MINLEIFPVKPLEVDSDVGYFFFWKSSLKSVMFTLLCIALRLPGTFMGVSRAVENNGKTSFLALWLSKDWNKSN